MINQIDYFRKKIMTECGIPSDSNTRIVFETILEELVPTMLGKFITTKGIQGKCGGKAYALKFRFDKSFCQLCSIFGVNNLVILEWKIIKYLPNIIICCAKYFATKPWKKDVSFVCNGVEIGDLLYDYIIRITNRYTVSGRLSIQEKITICKGVFIAVYCDKLFSQMHPTHFVSGELIYISGIPARYAAKYGAKIICVTTGKRSFLYPKNIIGNNYKLTYVDLEHYVVQSDEIILMKSDWEKKVDQYFDNIHNGVGDWNIEKAYGNKINAEREEALKAIGINNNKKNVLILPHCFSDGSHGSSRMIFRDYYDWYENTLHIIQSIKNVNWIIKEHPCSGNYGEAGIAKNLFDEYSSKGIFFFPPEYSSEVVYKIADAIITVRGSAGMEAACKGIPVVLSGKAYYSDNGFTIENKSMDEYCYVLNNLDKITPLSEEQINKAKKILYKGLAFSEIVDDEYQIFCHDEYLPYLADRPLNEFNTEEFLDKFISLIESKPLKLSYWYKWGADCCE